MPAFGKFLKDKTYHVIYLKAKNLAFPEAWWDKRKWVISASSETRVSGDAWDGQAETES
jgi:hypothetical protein